MEDQPIVPWDPKHALEALTEEQEVMGETVEDQAKRIFRDALPVAAMAVVHLAQYSGNEKTRLEAARYVVERNVGRLQDMAIVGIDDPMAALMAEIVTELQDAEK